MDALQITAPPFSPNPLCDWTEGLEKKNLFPAFEKIKSIFDNGESVTGSFIASSQQALLPESQFSGEEATISDKAEKALRGPGMQKASRYFRLLVETGPGGVT